MKFALMMTAASSLLAVPAGAATITQYRNISTAGPFDGFSASLGTLNRVTLEVTVNTYRQWFVSTPSGSAANTITWSIDSYYDVLAYRGGSPMAGFPLRVATRGDGSLVRNEGVFGVSASGIGTFDLDPSLFVTGLPIVLLHSDPGLSVESESGTTIGMSGAGVLIQTLGSCGFGVTSSGCGLGGATLIYDYTAAGSTPGAIPEPATWAMMIAGFGLAGAALRSARRGTARVTTA